MTRQPSGLPRYESPPVSEVAIAIQFDPLEEVKATHLGLLWSEFRERFPKIEEHSPRDPTFESFETPMEQGGGPQVQLVGSPPVPKFWFLTEDEAELIQVQQDRFVFNWRKREVTEEYPHYQHVRKRFKDNLDVFREFLDEQGLGKPTPNQCELSYLNRIEPGSVWDDHGDIGEVIPSLSTEYSDDFLGKPEDVKAVFRYRIPTETGDPAGRLHVRALPKYAQNGAKPIIDLRLIGRGLPFDSSFDGAFDFLDTAHEWIVRGFTSVTSSAMHREWERRDA